MMPADTNVNKGTTARISQTLFCYCTNCQTDRETEAKT